MQNPKILTALTAAIFLSTSAVYAAETDTEYCTVTNKSGANLVKAGMADCNSMMKMNCKVGDNMAGDSNASIMVPKGQCENIKAGNFSEMNAEVASKIKSKLNMDMMDSKTTTTKIKTKTNE